METFVAIYSGTTIDDARMVSVSASPDLVRTVAGEMLRDPFNRADRKRDAVANAVRTGRRRALELIVDRLRG